METGLYFSVKVGDLSECTFDVVEFNLEEALSELYSLTLTLSSTNAEIDLSDQLLKKVSFTVFSDGQKQRTINGIVASLKRGDSGFKRTFYTLEVKPELWQLTLTKDSRIYHFKSVPAIIDEILQEFGIASDKQLMDTHGEREYTTLKRESYYDFIKRLMAEEGITFWFEEDKLFYSDSRLGVTVGPEVIYNPHPQSAAKEAMITQLSYGAQMRPTEAKVKDYRYSHPMVALDNQTKSAKSLPVYTVYDSYGRYQDEAISKQFSRYRLEALQAESEIGEAVSNTIQLMPGKLFELKEHPSASMNARWQIVRITHSGTLPQSLDNESDDSSSRLTNHFTFIPAKTEWRPPFVHKPLADGDETATVVGPEDEEIYVNADGAVKVHFHWNYYDEADENASCWVRVAQNWNGDGFGFLATPRIDQEVIISYLNGDIDRPIITGTVYNGYNRPPIKLPESKTQTTIKTKTHKGEGFNELRFEDENGKQQIFIHAQKDMDIQVRNSKNERIDFDRTTSVGNDEQIAVANNMTLTVEGKQDQKTAGNFVELVEGDKNLSVKGDLIQNVSGYAGLSADSDFVVQSKDKLTLRVGNSFITIHAGGIEMKGPKIKLNSGSPAGFVAPTNPQILKVAAASGTPFVSDCPYKDKAEELL